MISVHYAIIIIFFAAISTALTRFLPFIIFDRGQEVAGWIKYLGKVLPPAIMSMLLLYCVRDVHITVVNEWAPQLICITLAAALHIWKRNTLLSIGVSTVLYMVLVQNVFI